jgi:CheY-like chemotaxis protein/ectoine hydroxylase-related dioxygenase (phytanoyl-CoA dioxygenase family)
VARILVVEDEENIRKIYRGMLENSGHEVFEAPDGKEGVRLFRQMHPDLIITDILMPHKDGVETIRELRRDFPNVQIIAVTGARGSFNRLPAARHLGAQHVLSKPFTLQDLQNAVEEALGSPAQVDERDGAAQERLDFYQENGYVVVPDALSAQEVRTANEAIDRDLLENKPLWMNRGNGRLQSVHALLARPDLDLTARPPRLLPLMEAILGRDLCAEEHSVMIRAPNPDGPTECHWHRDATHLPGQPYNTRYLSAVLYLTDVTDATHTFSVLPRTSQAPELPALAAPAGTAILFNTALLHAGNVRQTPSERRTVHLYCGRSTDASLSNHTIFPRRLWHGKDEATRRYYSRPNLITRLLLEHF